MTLDPKLIPTPKGAFVGRSGRRIELWPDASIRQAIRGYQPCTGEETRMTITITHPGARLLAPALDALADVVAGDWTTVARLCATRLRYPHACAADLRDLATLAGVTSTDRHPYRYRVRHRMLLVDEHPSLLAAALDLHTNLLLGRWDALEKAALPNGPPSASWSSAELLDVRILHQRPGTWSEHPYVTERLSEAPPAARLAHHVLTQIEGGPACCYDIPAGSPLVHVG